MKYAVKIINKNTFSVGVSPLVSVCVFLLAFFQPLGRSVKDEVKILQALKHVRTCVTVTLCVRKTVLPLQAKLFL